MIKFLDVSKKFGDGTLALDEITFEVEPGEFVVVTGPSGSGKTTLMRLLIRDFLPSKGEIYFEEAPLHEIESGSVPLHRRKVGVVFQDYQLLPELNVWENIALPLAIAGKSEEEIESRVTDLLSLVSLEDKALMFPKQLSGGEAQRVGIARALATGPRVIFADEPTGNLDKEASLGIVQLLQQINELGTTILLSTHDSVLLDALKKTRQIELEKGRMKGVASGKKIVKKPEPKGEPKKEKKEAPDKSEESAKEIVEKEKSPQEKEAPKKKKSRFALKLPFFSKKETSPQEPAEEKQEAGDALEEALEKAEAMKSQEEKPKPKQKPAKKDQKK